jgi:predicted Zn-dependent protease
VTAPPRSTFATALRAALAGDTRLFAWQIQGVRRRGCQTYLVKTQLESERETDAETYEVTVFVKNGELLGRATATLAPGDEAAFHQRLDDAVYMAGLGGDAPWTLPATASWPRVDLHDPALAAAKARDTSREIVDHWRAAAAGHPGVRPSSMELFCGEDWTTLENSAGLEAQASATRVSMLTLVLADGEHPSERYAWDERRRAADLDVKAIVDHAAEEARDLTRAVVPPSGQYPVVIDADEITALLDPVQVNGSAEGLYQKSSRFVVGKPLPIEGKDGDPFTVVSNAITAYGLQSYAFDANGVAGQRVAIVKDGVFVQPWAPKQFADYLKTAATGRFANWELPAGKTPMADLVRGDRVLYVRSFSWLTPDAARGNFSSEIRLGYLYENGTRRPIKGGTVSGNVFKALGTARYARESVFRGDYLGPEAVRFENLTIAGA